MGRNEFDGNFKNTHIKYNVYIYPSPLTEYFKNACIKYNVYTLPQMNSWICSTGAPLELDTKILRLSQIIQENLKYNVANLDHLKLIKKI